MNLSNVKRLSYPIAIAIFVTLFIFAFLQIEKLFLSFVKLYKQAHISVITIKSESIDSVRIEAYNLEKTTYEVRSNLRKTSYLEFIPLAKILYSDLAHINNSIYYFNGILLSVSSDGSSQATAQIGNEDFAKSPFVLSISKVDESMINEGCKSMNYELNKIMLLNQDFSGIPYMEKLKEEIESMRKTCRNLEDVAKGEKS